MDERYYRFVRERYHCNGNIVRSEKMESNLVSLIAVEVLTSGRFNQADVDGEFKEVGHTTHCCFRDTLIRVLTVNAVTAAAILPTRTPEKEVPVIIDPAAHPVPIAITVRKAVMSGRFSVQCLTFLR